MVTTLVCAQKNGSDIEGFSEGNLMWLRQYLPDKPGVPTGHDIAKIVRVMVSGTRLNALVSWANLRRYKAR